MHPRILQLLGFILVLVAAAMSFIVYQSTMMVSEPDLFTMITSGMVAWAIIALPELVIGL